MSSLDMRNKLIEKLYNHMLIPVIPSDEDADVPSGPYVVYSITSDYLKNGQDVIFHSTDIEGVTTQVYENLVESSFSFTVHSEQRDDAQVRCEELISFFDRTGRALLSDEGITVVSVGNVENRSIFLVDHYERRFGADVRVRYLSQTIQIIDGVNDVTITNAGGE